MRATSGTTWVLTFPLLVGDGKAAPVALPT
jgi:hypothetical protein